MDVTTRITGNVALPVELISFKCTATKNGVQLSWATATEINNEGFEVQRSSDGRHFSKIAWVEGHGNATEKHTYSFLDNAAKSNKTRHEFQTHFAKSNHFNCVIAAESIEKFYQYYNPAIANYAPLRMLLLDIDLPGMSGMDAIEGLKRVLPPEADKSHAKG